MLYSRGYIFLISKLPWLWYLIYRISAFSANNKIFALFRLPDCLAFRGSIRAGEAGRGNSTHFLTSSILTVFQEKCEAAIKIGFYYFQNIICILCGWARVDLIIAACDFARAELLRRKVSPDRIMVCGIPVKEKFYRQEDRRQIAAKYGIKDSLFTVFGGNYRGSGPGPD